MKIAVIILHHRNLSDTLECLASLTCQDYSNFEIILIDNGSQDASLVEAVRNSPNLSFEFFSSKSADAKQIKHETQVPRVVFIKNDSNLGFAEGNNVGIRYAIERGVSAVLLLNNDTTSSSNLLSTFVKASQAYPDAAVFGAKIYYYDDPTVIWHAGGNVNPLTLRCYHEGCPTSDLEKKWDEARDINYACGCAFFIKMDAIKKVGLLAPDFFLMWEEIDWCWRIRKAGYRCLYIPEAKLWHKISQSFEGGNRGELWQYYYFRNRLLFLKRNLSRSRRFRFYSILFLKELLQILFFSFSPTANELERKLNRSALKGISHYFIKRFGQLKN